MDSAILVETFYEKEGNCIKSRTTLSIIGNDTQVRPVGALWVIYNNGDTSNVIIDNKLVVKPGEKFGIDSTPLLLSSANLCFENETVFSIRFNALI